MVLTELGNKIKGALKSLNASTTITDEVLKDVLKQVCAALMESDVNIGAVKKLRDNILNRVDLENAAGGTNKQRIIQQAVFQELVAMLDSGRDAFKPKKGKSNVIMFVGLQGAGKTTTIAKYARHYQLKRWKVAMVCADTFRAGAFDQLKQNAARVQVPFYGSYVEPDPVKIAREGVEQFKKEGFEMIIVDTSGRHKQESALFEEMEQVKAAVNPDDIVFVMDSTIGQAAAAHAKAFHDSVPVGSVVITKLDGHAHGGGALSAVAQTGAPITFYGTGEHFDDLDPFEPTSFVRRLLGMGDMAGLFEVFKDRVGFENQEEMIKSLKEGVFTLRHLYDQFSNVLKLGPLNKVMEMMPAGFSQLMARGSPEEGGKRIKRFLYAMDSMTDDELDCVVPMNESRIRRVARGSGTSVMEMEMLLKTHKQFGKMFAKGGLGKLMAGGDGKLAQQLARNPQALAQQLGRGMGRGGQGLLQQMGGASGLLGMVKQMSSDPGMMQAMRGAGMGGDGGMDMGSMMQAMKGMGGMGGLAGMMGGGGGAGRGRGRRAKRR